MSGKTDRRGGYHAAVYAAVRRIPRGKVTTYGRIAAMIERCTPRMVGYALAASGPEQKLPWQRVVNASGRISAHGDGAGSLVQRELLEREGVRFDRTGRIDLGRYGWP